jgi:hypothetical protein
MVLDIGQRLSFAESTAGSDVARISGAFTELHRLLADSP